MAEAAAVHADILATQAAILARPAGRERRMADAVRAFAIDAAEAAKSAHAGMPLGMADAATMLWTRFLKFDAADPRWPDRDRFVLSAGHGSVLLYALLHLTGHAGMGVEPCAASAPCARPPPACRNSAPIRPSRRAPGRSARASPPPSAWRSPSA